MLAQDPLTGYLHEVPDAYYGYDEYPEFVGEAPVVYDGLGNPVGLPFLAPIAAAAGPLIAKAAGALAPMAGRLLPQAGRLIGRLIPQAGGLLRNLLPGGGAPARIAPPAFPRFPGLPIPRPYRPRPFFRAPHPVGWVTPALPFTGTQPRRMYLRCAVWPGPGGLVPGFATQPMPGAPGMTMPLRRRRRRRR